MDKKVMVSVVMITYNQEKFIKEAIEGVLKQQGDFDVELIIADDKSTDTTEAVVLDIISNHKNGSWISYTKHNVNKGMMPNFIWTIQQCRGKYIALCEGDDYWTDPLKLQKQVDFLEENPDCVVTGHDAMIVDEKNNLIKKSKLPDEYKRDATALELKQRFWVLTLAMVFRNIPTLKNFPKEIFEVTNGDTFLISMLGQFGYYHYMPQIEPGVYRKHDGGVWSSMPDSLKINSARNTFLKLHQYYKRTGDTYMANYFYRLKVQQADKYLYFSLNKGLVKDFSRAYLMYFKDYMVYKNPKRFIYLHKSALNFFLTKLSIKNTKTR